MLFLVPTIHIFKSLEYFLTPLQVLVGSLVEKCSKDTTEATAETLDEVMECGQEKVKVMPISDWL